MTDRVKQTRMERSVQQIVNDDLCIGCGVCDPSCPENAIKISFNKYKEYQPVINPETCTNCGKCLLVCPSSSKNLNSRFNTIKLNGISAGTEKAITFYRGFEIDYPSYEKSSSGGLLTALLKHLLSEKVIDAVVHAEMNFGDTENSYFSSKLSRTITELDENRSSFYYPIELSQVIAQIKSDSSIQNVAILGVPCVLSGIHYLAKKDPELSKKIKYKFSLICSHNTNGQFAENLRSSLSPNAEGLTKLKFRDKSNIKEALNFNNTLLLQNGEKISEERNKSGFTNKWRTYNFALNGCLFCPDFFGMHAHAGFKDAWGVKTGRLQGETLCFINAPEITAHLEKMKENKVANLIEITREKFIYSQKDTLVYKQLYSQYRQNQKDSLKKQTKIHFSLNLLEWALLKTDFILKKKIIRKSKEKWLNEKRSMSDKKLGRYEFIFRKINAFLGLTSLLRRDKDGFNVIYTSGFGYDNIGDEAQLNSNLKIWKETVPHATVTLLSPNPNKTRKIHVNYNILSASRNCLWGFRGIEYGGIGNKKHFTKFFRIKFLWVRINCFFIKHFNVTFGLNPEAGILLFTLKNARVQHIGGGGFLTGKTASRLLDFMGLIRIANYFKTDVILSGHNIGIWETRYQKKLARQLNKAMLIGLRDDEDSVKDLKEIGLFDPQKVFTLFDDALFCEHLSEKDFADEMYNQGINDTKKIIAINAQYWKFNVDEINWILDEIAASLAENFNEELFELVLIAQDPSDIPALEYLKQKLALKATILNYGPNFKLVVSTYKKRLLDHYNEASSDHFLNGRKHTNNRNFGRRLLYAQKQRGNEVIQSGKILHPC